MQHLKRSPGALARDATGAKVKGADTRYGRFRPQHQAHRLGHEPAARRSPFDRAKSPRARSDYLPGSDFMPDEETLARRQEEVLELLKEVSSNGVTKLEAPEHLSLGLSARVHELRRRGFRIDTLPEQVAHRCILPSSS